MELEEEYRDLCGLLRNNPDGLELIVKIFAVKKRKLLIGVENSDNKEQLWDLKTRLSFLTEFSREIITHSKSE